MPKVKAVKFFISAQFGNVDTGRILEVSDHQAKAFVSHGFVKLMAEDVPPESKKSPDREGRSPLDFTPPAGGRQASGSSSQAGTVSQKRTAKKSVSGAKRARKKRAKKKPKTS